MRLRFTTCCKSCALTVLCDGDRFAHVQRLRCDPTLADLFGVEAIVSDDTIRRLFAQVEEQAGAAWVAAAVPLWGALLDPLILDWDATVQTKYGHQEGAAIGYNRTGPGGAACNRFWRWRRARGCA